MRLPTDEEMMKESPTGTLFEDIKYTHTQGRKIKALYPKDAGLVARADATMQKAKLAYARARCPWLYAFDLVKELLG